MNFQIGDHVVMTQSGIDNGLDGHRHLRTGTVKGFARNGFPRIQRDGIKSIEVYHPQFWRIKDGDNKDR